MAERPTDPDHPAGTGAGLGSWLADERALDSPPRPGAGRTIAAVVSLLVVLALLWWGLPLVTGATRPEILDALRAAPGWALPAMVGLGLLALALESVTVHRAMPGSRPGVALRAHAAGTAAGTALPGGGLLGPLLLGHLVRRSGVGLGVVVTGIVLASLVELAVTSVALPLTGIVAYLVQGTLPGAPGGTVRDLPGGPWPALLALLVALVSLALVVVLLRRPVLAALLRLTTDLLGAPAGPMPADLAPVVLGERDRLVGLLRTRPLSLVLPTVAARVVQGGAFLLALVAVGAEVPILLVVAVFALARLLALVPITPGGAGITETVAAAALAALGTAAADAGAAVLLLAVATWVTPLLAGAAALVLTPRRVAEPSRSA